MSKDLYQSIIEKSGLQDMIEYSEYLSSTNRIYLLIKPVNSEHSQLFFIIREEGFWLLENYCETYFIPQNLTYLIYLEYHIKEMEYSIRDFLLVVYYLQKCFSLVKNGYYGANTIKWMKENCQKLHDNISKDYLSNMIR